MRFRRRYIPPSIAIAFGFAAISPLITGWPDELTTNKATLLLIAVMFAFMTLLFWWMRSRMTDHGRALTRFGEALVDFFTAVTLCDLAITVLFAISYWYAHHGMLTPYWLRVSDRASLAAGAAFAISTGAAVAFEMRIAGARLRVHEEGS